MPKTKSEKPKRTAKFRAKCSGVSAEARRVFLIHLAESSNISASAKAAGVERSAFYAEKRRLTSFAQAWQEALVEGYERIEADLLEEARTKATGNTGESTLKARAAKQKLQLALLAHHRAAVKNAPDASPAKPKAPSTAETKILRAKLIAKLENMRAKIAQSEAGTQNAAEHG